jgi:hypothetical protein
VPSAQARGARDLGERVDEPGAIDIIPDYRVALVAPSCDVAHAPGLTCFPRHIAELLGQFQHADFCLMIFGSLVIVLPPLVTGGLY